MLDQSITTQSQSRELLGHPKGLAVLFFTEMWERFSYYGMRALLIFYLTEHFLFSDEKSYAIYGAYTSLVYLAPVMGGALADRYLGARKAVTLGAVLLVLGHAGMALEGPPANVALDPSDDGEIIRSQFYLQVFYLSLALIVTGVGFLKANISTLVGALYEHGDQRRDSGFTLFYMGINLGAFAAPLLCGYLGQTLGWAYGFGAAGLGMLAGLAVFLRGQASLPARAEPPNMASLKAQLLLRLNREQIIYIGTLLAVLLFWQLIQYSHLVGAVLSGFGVWVVVTILFYSLFRCSSEQRDKMLVALLLIVMAVLFFALFEQAGSSLNILAQRHVDRQLIGVEVRASQLQSLNALFIFLLAPVLAFLWVRLSRQGAEPSTPAKFSLALIFAGLGFVVLAFGAGQASDTGKIALVWLVLLYFLHTLGELCISPVGLSMITKLSLPNLVGFMMGAWFLALSTAHFIAAQIAKLTGNVAAAADPAAALQTVIEVYWKVGALAIVAGLVLAFAAPMIRRRMHDVH